MVLLWLAGEIQGIISHGCFFGQRGVVTRQRREPNACFHVNKAIRAIVCATLGIPQAHGKNYLIPSSTSNT